MSDPIGPLRALGDVAVRPPEDLDALGARVARRARRRWARRGALLAAAIVVAGSVALSATDGEDEGLRTVDDPPPTTVEGGSATVPSGSLVFGEHGIEQVDDGGRLVSISDERAALALAVGDLVVAQAAEPGDVHPPIPTGPIVVFDDGPARELDVEPADRVRLLDAGSVDGRPVAVATTTQGAGHEDTEERLWLVDLTDGTQVDLGVVGGFESGVEEAHLSGTTIVTIQSASAELYVAVLDLAGRELWRALAGQDTSLAAAVAPHELQLLRPGFDELRGFAPVLDIRRWAAPSGAPGSATQLDVEPVDDLTIEGGFCSRAEVLGTSLVCDQSSGPPFVLDRDGTARPIAGVDHGTVTLRRDG